MSKQKSLNIANKKSIVKRTLKSTDSIVRIRPRDNLDIDEEVEKIFSKIDWHSDRLRSEQTITGFALGQSGSLRDMAVHTPEFSFFSDVYDLATCISRIVRYDRPYRNLIRLGTPSTVVPYMCQKLGRGAIICTIPIRGSYAKSRSGRSGKILLQSSLGINQIFPRDTRIIVP